MDRQAYYQRAVKEVTEIFLIELKNTKSDFLTQNNIDFDNWVYFVLCLVSEEQGKEEALLETALRPEVKNPTLVALMEEIQKEFINCSPFEDLPAPYGAIADRALYMLDLGMIVRSIYDEAVERIQNNQLSIDD